MRTFVAIEIPDSLRRILGSDRIRAPWGFPGISWVGMQHLHLTVRFLGELDPELIFSVTDAMREASGSVPAFELEVNDLGAFPDSRRPRVLWAGIKDHPDLTRLRDLLEQGLSRRAFEQDRDRFHPHITLGRVRFGQSRFQEKPFAETGRLGTLPVAALALLESRPLDTARETGDRTRYLLRTLVPLLGTSSAR